MPSSFDRLGMDEMLDQVEGWTRWRYVRGTQFLPQILQSVAFPLVVHAAGGGAVTAFRYDAKVGARKVVTNSAGGANNTIYREGLVYARVQSGKGRF